MSRAQGFTFTSLTALPPQYDEQQFINCCQTKNPLRQETMWEGYVYFSRRFAKTKLEELYPQSVFTPFPGYVNSRHFKKFNQHSSRVEGTPSFYHGYPPLNGLPSAYIKLPANAVHLAPVPFPVPPRPVSSSRKKKKSQDLPSRSPPLPRGPHYLIPRDPSPKPMKEVLWGMRMNPMYTAYQVYKHYKKNNITNYVPLSQTSVLAAINEISKEAH